MSLNCKIAKGVSASCTPTVAGVLRLAVANWDESYTFTQSTGSCLIDTIDLGNEKVYAIDIADGSGSATSTGTIGANGSSRYHLHQVSGIIQRLGCDELEEYNNLFMGKFIAFVETRNHDVFIFGVDNGLNASTFEFTTGQGEGDQTGIAFVFDGAEPNPPLKVSDWSVVKALM